MEVLMKKILLLIGVCIMLSGAVNASKVIMLKSDYPDTSQKFSSELEQALKSQYEVQSVNNESLITALNAEMGKGTILLMADGRYFPSNAKQALVSFLKRGNHLFALSGPVFENYLFQFNGKWLTNSEIQSAILKTPGRSIIDFNNQDIKKWTRSSGAMENPTEYVIEPSGHPSVPTALRGSISKLDNWDLIISPAMTNVFQNGEGALLFWAKGAPGTNQIKVQWIEEDGARWIAPVKITDKWQRYALLPTDFKFWKDGSPSRRGGYDDKLNLSKVSKLTFIMEMDPTSPTPGKPRTFWVSDIRAAVDPTAESLTADILLETLSPQFKVFRTTPAYVTVPEISKRFELNEEIVSPISRAPGYGSDDVRKWRFIPVGKAYSSDDQYRGTGAHILINTLGDYTGSLWGAIGFSQSYLERESADCIALTMHMLNKISSNVFMTNAGSEIFAYEDNERPSYGAYIANLGDANKSVKVDISILSDENVVKTLSLNGDIPAGSIDAPVKLTIEDDALPAGEYTVKTTLSVDDAVVDEITHSFNVIKYRTLAKRETIQIKDGDFTKNFVKWYPLGINYWPRAHAGLEPEDFLHWLSPKQYDPGIIEADLKLMNDLKINTVSIQYMNINESRPLMDFMARAEKHGIMVHVFVEGLHPLTYTMWGGVPTDTKFMDAGGKLIEAARLAKSPAFFAYDLGWEVTVGKYDRRKVFNQKWNDWIIDRYKSIESAVKDWKYQPQMVDNLVDGPSDDQLITDGEWRTYIAAYRRFWDDEISQGYKRVRENIKSIDKYHLMGARSGYGGTGYIGVADHMPFDLASGAYHLDFTGPEAYMLRGDYDNFLQGGLNNAYGRYFSNNKPVFWPEFGLPVVIGIQPSQYKHRQTPENIDAQTDFYKNMIRLTMETNANGLTGWWWPGGFRLHENSDFGIIDPDGTPRPSALEIQKNADAFYKPRPLKEYDTFLTVDRDKYVSGYAGIYNEFAKKYAAAVKSGKNPGIRTEGTGTTSANTPLIAVGNTPYNGKNPPKYLNSEIQWLMVNGKKVVNGSTVYIERGSDIYVRASVLNSADALWISSKSVVDGAVYMTASIGEFEAYVPIFKDTPFLNEVSIIGSFTPPKTDAESFDITFNMASKGRMKFGDTCRITIEYK